MSDESFTWSDQTAYRYISAHIQGKNPKNVMSVVRYSIRGKSY